MNPPEHSVEEEDPVFQDQGCLDMPLQDELPENDESDEQVDEEKGSHPASR